MKRCASLLLLLATLSTAVGDGAVAANVKAGCSLDSLFKQVVDHANEYSFLSHPYWSRLASLRNKTDADPTAVEQLGALWSFYGNMRQVTCEVPNWLSRVMINTPQMRLKALLGRIIYDELGSGTPSRVHCLLMDKLLEALKPYMPKREFDVWRAGKKLKSAMQRLFNVTDQSVDSSYYVIGSLMVGEIYAEQMIYRLAKEIRAQKKIPVIPGGPWEWQLIHEEVEHGHADTSYQFKQVLEDFPDQESDRAKHSVQQGVIQKRHDLLNLMDGVYESAFGEKVPKYNRNSFDPSIHAAKACVAQEPEHLDL